MSSVAMAATALKLLDMLDGKQDLPEINEIITNSVMTIVHAINQANKAKDGIIQNIQPTSEELEEMDKATVMRKASIERARTLMKRIEGKNDANILS